MYWYQNTLIETNNQLQVVGFHYRFHPSLLTGPQYEVTFYENITPASTDTAVLGPVLYDPEKGVFYTDMNPIKLNRVDTY